MSNFMEKFEGPLYTTREVNVPAGSGHEKVFGNKLIIEVYKAKSGDFLLSERLAPNPDNEYVDCMFFVTHGDDPKTLEEAKQAADELLQKYAEEMRTENTFNGIANLQEANYRRIREMISYMSDLDKNPRRINLTDGLNVKTVDVNSPKYKAWLKKCTKKLETMKTEFESHVKGNGQGQII